ncbi:hypothetical protein ACFX2I_021412 [Malus domestica]
MYKHPWRIEKFSKLKYEWIQSKPFNVVGMKWKLVLFPKGRYGGKGNHVALYLALVDPKSLLPDTKILTEVTFRIINQESAKIIKPDLLDAMRWGEITSTSNQSCIHNLPIRKKSK